MTKLTLIPVGDELGVTMPAELLENLGVREGDILEATWTPDGILLSAGESAFQRQMAVARRIMHERSDILRRLADS